MNISHCTYFLQVTQSSTSQALANLAPTIPKLRTEVIPMRGRVVSGKPRLLEEICTMQRRRMKNTVKTINN